MNKFVSIVTAVVLSLTLATRVNAAPDQPTLSKITKVTALVLFDDESSPPYGMSLDRLRTILELRLRSAGLKVLTKEEDARDPDVNPYVFLRVSSMPTKNQGGVRTGYMYNADLSARVFGVVPTNKTMAPMELWHRGQMGIGPTEGSGSAIESIVNQLIDELVNQWLKENPKR